MWLDGETEFGNCNCRSLIITLESCTELHNTTEIGNWQLQVAKTLIVSVLESSMSLHDETKTGKCNVKTAVYDE